MSQKHLNIIAVCAVAALLIFAGWAYLVAPLACPVPKGLLSQDGQVPCFEFWFARYQSVITAAIALIGVLIATRPVMRQASIMDMQYALQRTTHLREQLERRYYMLTDLQKLLDRDAWVAEDPIPNPSTAPEAFENKCGAPDPFGQRKYLMNAFQARVGRAERLISNLRSHPFDAAEREAVEAAISKIEFAISEGRDMISGRVKNPNEWRSGELDVGPMWFHCVDRPDSMISNAIHVLSGELERAKARVVSELAKGPQ
jgi:hypothetical protein